VQADVANAEDVERLFKESMDAFGRPDVVVPAWFCQDTFSWFEREFFGSAKNLSGFSNRSNGRETVNFFAVLLITNHFVFFCSIGLTQRHFGSILAE